MISRAALFEFANRWVTRGLLGVQSVNRGLWLGLMDPPALQEVTQRHYADSRRYGGATHHAAGLLGWEVLLVQRYLAGCRTVLVGAAGGGREAFALARQGFQVDAFDCSPELVETAQRALAFADAPVRVQTAPPSEVPRGLGSYDAVILGWGAYSHVPGRAARVRLLVDLARHLAPGGPLLFSFLPRASEADERFFRWTCRIAGGVRWLRRSRSPVEPGDALFRFFVHRFTRAEIAREVAAAGLVLEHFADHEYGAAVARAEGGDPR